MNTPQLTALALASLTLTACKTATYNAPSTQNHQPAHSTTNYTLGNEQSPINIPQNAPIHPADISFNYNPFPLEILNNSHTIQVNAPSSPDSTSTITIEGTTYTLLQFHFHALSEHTINDQYAPMEVHFVHKSDDGQYAVIGAFLNESESPNNNPNYAPIFNNIPHNPGQPKAIAHTSINPYDLLPSNKTYYRYNGSLTTPPYTEGLKWFVMSTPVTLSQSQIAAYTALYPDNYRPVQPLNRRTIYATAPSDD